MGSKQSLVLIPSHMMDANKKKDRKEDSLVRMSARVREHLGFDEDRVSVFANKNENVDLAIFKAFVEDIKQINNMGFTEAEKNRIAFVTTATYNRITKEKETKSNIELSKKVWISKEEEQIVFGADPEFLIYKGAEIVPAHILLNHTGLMGSDGAMAEVRPAPATSPDQLVINIKQIFESKAYEEVVQNYILKAACYVKTDLRDYPVGGHIHIGSPEQILGLPTVNKGFIFKTINRILDELLSIPLVKLDGKEQGKNRRVGCKMATKGGYGFFGEYRTTGTGKEFRLEHRTLSGMWLIHPTVALATLGVAKAIIDEVWLDIINKEFDLNYIFPEKYFTSNLWNKGFNEWKNFPICQNFGCTSSSDDLIKQLHEPDPAFINKDYLDVWLLKMKKMTTYKKYQTYINLLYDILKIDSEKLEKQDRTIQKNWLEDKKFIVN